jgi:hypothetical protein
VLVGVVSTVDILKKLMPEEKAARLARGHGE